MKINYFIRIIISAFILLFIGCELLEGPEKEGRLAIVIEFPANDEVAIQPGTGKMPGQYLLTSIERVYCEVTV